MITQGPGVPSGPGAPSFQKLVHQQGSQEDPRNVGVHTNGGGGRGQSSEQLWTQSPGAGPGLNPSAWWTVLAPDYMESSGKLEAKVRELHVSSAHPRLGHIPALHPCTCQQRGQKTHSLFPVLPPAAGLETSCPHQQDPARLAAALLPGQAPSAPPQQAWRGSKQAARRTEPQQSVTEGERDAGAQPGPSHLSHTLGSEQPHGKGRGRC